MTTAVGMAVSVLGPVGPAWAQAQADAATYSVPAGSLARALNFFADQAGLTLLYPSAVTAGRSTAGLSGSFGQQEALRRLLSGTGLSYRFTGPGTVTIEDASAADAEFVFDDGTILLETVKVAAWGRAAANGSGFRGTPDWVYEAPSSISVISRDAIASANVRDTRDLLSNVAGAYANSSNATYPSISPNLRGLQDMGRVVVSIDGARQNASQTVAAGSETYQGGSSHAYVDSAFIRSVEVSKNTAADGASGGALGGAVTFRTVGADDLIEDGGTWGLELNVTTGSNSHDFQGSILGAARLTDTPFSITAGLSGLNLGEYRLGQNGTVVWNGADTDQTNLMGRENWSSLLKVEGDFEDVEVALTWTHQEKNFAYAVGGPGAQQTMQATTDTLTASLGWDPADNELIDLNTRLWLNNTLTNQLRHQRTNELGTILAPDTFVDGNLLSFGASIDNTSRFETPLGPLSVNYGAEVFRDNGTVEANSTSITANPSWASNYTAFSPAGIRDMASVYANATIEPADWVKLTGGLRYDWHRLQGTPTYYSQTTETVGTPSRQAGAVTTYRAWALAHNQAVYNQWNNRCLGITITNPVQIAAACARLNLTGEIINGVWYATGAWIQGNQTTRVIYPATTLDIDRSAGALLPSATIELTPLDWFRPYISYGHSMRPPTISEAFFAGGSPGDGAPGIGYAPYEGLLPETARTWEIGANLAFDGLLLEDDTLRFKLAAFDRTIDNYIVVGQHYPANASKQYIGFMNLLDQTRMQGVEIEGNYDARQFWIGGSATWLQTEWGQQVAVTGAGADVTDGKVFMWAGDVPPKFKVTLDGGVRLLDETLTLGATVTHVTPTLTHEQSFSEDGAYLTDAYTSVDLYGAYALNENATIRLGIANAFDVNYVPAGSRYPAPGRTVTLSLNAKF
ncbi:TonB-dependent heme/hemoglobin receptor family protein [Devosia yakushimensis]|uniref:TonB-dependent heme/hemoglobin receptor family protein n=1 Tax=Devosia yakushimensis TaxID=470028 RepID=A0ABQ5UJ68_9HYPH|nr:TonB-dependent receptor [Devosia yakushimensis]GLQ10676.1 TonB-dependent heme/hemoglobin receptor family protein [Devosia yakushimensis]